MAGPVSLSQNQRLFASALSKASGLDPKTVEAWMIAEEPAGANAGYGGTQNWLNVGITDSGPRGSGNAEWKNPVSAGEATADFLQGQPDPGFGKASPGIRGILKTVGQSPADQLAAIASSGWASSGYGGAAKLQSLLGQVGGQLPNVNVDSSSMGKIPMVSAHFQNGASSTPSGPNIFSVLGGLEQTREALSGQASSPIEQGWTDLAQIWNTEHPSSPTPVGAVSAPFKGVAIHSVGDVDPLKHFTIGRTDQGIDASAKPGTPILAPNRSQVVAIYPNWYAGQPYLLMKYLDGPNSGKYYYVAEQITGMSRPGTVVAKGQPIAVFAPHGTGIEMGWGTAGSRTLAQATTGYTEGQQTQAGKSYRQYLAGLGS